MQQLKNKLQQGWRKPGLLNYLLLPLTVVYVAMVKIRQYCYNIGIFRSSQLPVPVIVVGGVGVGGSGKSPLVIALTKRLQAKGYRPGVISRGYGGTSAFWPREVDHTTNTEIVGDEPQLIFELCGVAVVVGPNRTENGRYLVDKRKCDVLVSDDGFQHFSLKRDIDIVVIDGEFGFGNGWCLPAGPLREPKSGIDRADIVVENALPTSNTTDRWWCMKPQDQNKYYSMTMVLQEVVNLQDHRHRNLSEFVGQTIHAVAGIGNPTRFFSQLKTLGINITPHIFPDHHYFVEQDLIFDDDQLLLMTEKDGIKCRDMSIAKNIWVVPAKLCIGEAFYQRVEALIA